VSRLIEISLFAVIVGSVIGAIIWLTTTQSGSGDHDLPKALLGAFSGAFFAFVFIRLGDAMSKLYDRQAKNYDGLVRIQHQLNDFLNLTSDNIFIVDTYLETFTDEAIKSENPSVFFNQFHEYPISRDLLLSFTNIDYANEVYQLYVEIQKLNSSMSSVDRSYDQIRSAFIDKKIDLKTYIKNVELTRSRHKEIKLFLIRLQKDLIRTLAAARLLCNSKPPLSRMIIWLSRSKYSSRFNEKLNAEILKLETEVKTISGESKKKIDEIRSGFTG